MERLLAMYSLAWVGCTFHWVADFLRGVATVVFISVPIALRNDGYSHLILFGISAATAFAVFLLGLVSEYISITAYHIKRRLEEVK